MLRTTSSWDEPFLDLKGVAWVLVAGGGVIETDGVRSLLMELLGVEGPPFDRDSVSVEGIGISAILIRSWAVSTAIGKNEKGMRCDG